MRIYVYTFTYLSGRCQFFPAAAALSLYLRVEFCEKSDANRRAKAALVDFSGVYSAFEFAAIREFRTKTPLASA